MSQAMNFEYSPIPTEEVKPYRLDPYEHFQDPSETDCINMSHILAPLTYS